MTSIIIPTRFNRLTLHDIVSACDKPEYETILVFDQSSIIPKDYIRDKAVLIPQEGRSIYHWWNQGLDASREDECIILNDDITITETQLRMIADSLHDSDLVCVNSTNGQAPISGHCFGLNRAKIRLDENYVWWYGDADLYKRAEAQHLRILHLPITVKNDHEGIKPPDYKRDIRNDRLIYESHWNA